MNKVPTMISTKDLAYISDMINWNFIACKKANHFVDEITDEQVKDEVKNVALMHKNHVIKLVNILGGADE